MEKKKRRLGDRYDGRKVRTLSPMTYVGVVVMRHRNEASNFFNSKVNIDAAEKYIHEKRAAGMDSYGFMHLFIAVYVRTIAKYPALNRFIAGQKVYQRNEIVMSMMVKKGMGLNAQETGIKPTFELTDTADIVWKKMEDEIKIAREENDSTNLDTVARAIVKMPTVILRAFVALMSSFDYFGIMPKVINTASPFHASVFLTNLGSLGIPPIYHHLYNFGNCPVFLAFGAKETEYVMDKEGNMQKRKMIPFTVVTDERITDGHYYASAFKYMDSLLRHPHVLDRAPEKIVEDID